MLSTSNTPRAAAFSQASSKHTPTDALGKWARHAKDIALAKTLANMSPADGQPGAVLASPSRANPDYYYHWVRDAARTMRLFVHLYNTSDASGKRLARIDYHTLLERYVTFSKLNQATSTLSASPGEPKFYVTGESYSEAWGRPQNDGPAQRAYVLTRWAQHLLMEGEEAYVRGVLYDGRLPSFSVIKTDLEFVAHHWRDPCFDLWEEISGQHFFTRLQQRQALVEGAALAEHLGDPRAAAYYLEQASVIESQMDQFWSPGENYLKATVPSPGGFKSTDLDAAVVLAVCETYSKHFPSYTPDSDRVLATAFALHSAFLPMYAINRLARTTEGKPIFPGIGRYPDDTYDGGQPRNVGNPWFLCTLTLSELCYKASSLFKSKPSISINGQNVGMLNLAAQLTDPSIALAAGNTVRQESREHRAIVTGLFAAGDAYLRRVQLHAGEDCSLSEQFNRNTGAIQSARDLTWSYVAMILTESWRSLAAREALVDSRVSAEQPQLISATGK